MSDEVDSELFRRIHYPTHHLLAQETSLVTVYLLAKFFPVKEILICAEDVSQRLKLARSFGFIVQVFWSANLLILLLMLAVESAPFFLY